MADDNLERQVDEIEAVSSIYGDQWRVEDSASRIYTINITDETSELSLTLQVQLPGDYPSEAPPLYELSAPWLRGHERTELCNELENIYLENLGESLIFLWAERIREHLAKRGSHGNTPNIPAIESPSRQSPSKPSTPENHPSPAAQDERSCDLGEDSDEDFNPGLVDEMATCTVAPTTCTVAPEVAEHTESLTCPEIYDSELLRDRKSVFQAHLAHVSHPGHVKLVMDKLCENRKIAAATHNIQAYRILSEKKGNPITYQGCVDDGEIHAGSRMLHLLQIVRASNVLVVVTRWYGGVHLGPDRFKHINNLTRQILLEHGFIKEKDDKKGPKSGKKGRKSQGAS